LNIYILTSPYFVIPNLAVVLQALWPQRWHFMYQNHVHAGIQIYMELGKWNKKHSGNGRVVEIACGKKSVKNVLSRFIGLGQLQDNKTVNKHVIYLGCALKTGNTLIIIIW